MNLFVFIIRELISVKLIVHYITPPQLRYLNAQFVRLNV